jgi:hypothetical protein
MVSPPLDSILRILWLETEVPFELADTATRRKCFLCLAINPLSVLIILLTYCPWRYVVFHYFLA